MLSVETHWYYDVKDLTISDEIHETDDSITDTDSILSNINIQESDYDLFPSDLKIVYFISGYIAFSLTEKLNCESCIKFII